MPDTISTPITSTPQTIKLSYISTELRNLHDLIDKSPISALHKLPLKAGYNRLLKAYKGYLDILVTDDSSIR